MQLLYGKLSPDEAARVAEAVGEAGCQYEVRNGGAAIYVPADRVYELRMALASEGIPSSGQPGYDLFDNEGITVSPYVQKINFGRALEGELARTIQLLDSVTYARVHIVRPEPSLFAKEEGSPAATVVLKLAGGGRLGQGSVAAITHLVAGSVQGLVADNVVVVDADGRLLSGRHQGEPGIGTTLALDYKLRVEEYLAGKAENMLALALGPSRATVKVDADLDMQSRRQRTTTPDKKGAAVQSEELTEKSSTASDGGAGASGKSGERPGGKTERESTTATQYLVGQREETVVDIPGEIEKLSIAAFVDLTGPSAEDEEGETASRKLSTDEVEEIIKQAVGFNQARGDSLTVVDVPFQRSVTTAKLEQEYEASHRREFFVGLARNASLGALALAAVFVMKMLLGRGRPTAAPAAPSGEGAEAAVGMETETNERTYVLNQINHALKENPQEVQKLFLSWVEEGES